MKRIVLSIGLLALMVLGGAGIANAQGVGVYVVPIILAIGVTMTPGVVATGVERMPMHVIVE
jgi:hypothetical protein